MHRKSSDQFLSAHCNNKKPPSGLCMFPTKGIDHDQGRPKQHVQLLYPTRTMLIVGGFTLVVSILTASTHAQNMDDNSSSSTSTPNENVSSNPPRVEIVRCLDCTPPDAVVYPWVTQLLGCVVLFLLTRFNLPVPYAAVMFILGAFMGAASSLTSTNNVLSRSITQWTNIDSDLLLLVFLPGLIFKDAVTIPIQLFLVALWQIWILAFPMVLVGTALTALVGYYVLPYEWPIAAAAMLGAILASTDPIAVSSVLKTAGASPRLVMHISGESLLNDGSSFVFFTIFSQLFYIQTGIADQDSPDSISVADGFVIFVRMSLGGTCVGAAFGASLLLILWELDRRLEREFDILQVVCGLTTAYLCYFVCDQLLGMSGVVAVVTCGVLVNYFGRGMINDANLMESYLGLAEYLLNTLLFTLGGTIWASISFENDESYQIRGIDWVWLLILYVLVLLIRFVQVGLFYPIVSRIGLKSDWREAVFLAYGGLRGAVGVALGLALIRHVFDKTSDDDIRKLVTILQFMGGGVTLLTLSINGTSAGPILKLLSLAKPTISAERVRLLFEGMAADFVYEQIAQLRVEARFQKVNFVALKQLVPFVTTETTSSHADGNGPASNFSSYTVRQFNRSIGGDGEQYLQLVNLATNTTADGAKSSVQDKEQLLVELRQIFFELLREAYSLLVELGELDLQEDNGYLYEILQASVNLAKNEVEHNQAPIEDWKWTQKFRFGAAPTVASTDAKGSAGDYNRLGSSVSSWAHRSNQSRTSAASLPRSRASVRRIRLDVLRSLAFQRGHAMARSKLDLLINRTEIGDDSSSRDTIQLTLGKVKEESMVQVKEAQEMLEQEICTSDLEVILSHYCSGIVVRRLIKFTEKKADDGTLGKIEARIYLREMDERLRIIADQTMAQLLQGERISDDACDRASDIVAVNVAGDANAEGSGLCDDPSI